MSGRTTSLTRLSDLNSADTGEALFSEATANRPPNTEGDGVVITICEGDVGWQLASTVTHPRILWQRTLIAGVGRWRNWKKFADLRTINQVITAAISTASQSDRAALETLLGERLRSEASARDDAIATALARHESGLDASAVSALIDGRISHERTARNDAINAAITAISSSRQGLVDARISSAISAERATIDRSVDDKISGVETKASNWVKGVGDKIVAETAARTQAITEVNRQTQQAISAASESERIARDEAIRLSIAALEGKISSQQSWTPVITVENNETQSVLRIADWTGGVGTKPPTGYVGPDGLVAAINDAVDIRGATGQDGINGQDGADGLQGPQGPEGPRGAQGSQGPRGVPGPQGARGPAGPRGPSGGIGAHRHGYRGAVITSPWPHD